MKMRGKVLVFAILSVLLVSSVLAYSEVNVVPKENEINFGEEAVFDVSITNYESASRDYSFYSTSFYDWNVDTSPPDTLLSVSPNATSSIDIYVSPYERLDPGIYLVPLTVETSQGSSYVENMKVYLGAQKPMEYQPSILTSVDINEKINPQEVQSIRVFLQNQNQLNYTNLTISIKSDLEEFEKQQNIELKPYESKTVEFAVTPDPYTQPKDYYLFFTLRKGEEIFKTFDHKIEIIPLTPEFDREIQQKEKFLKTTSVITFTNNGNVRNQQVARIRMGFFKDLVTSTEPNAYAMKDDEGRRYIAWDLELGVGESATVTVKTSYRIPVIVLILLAVLIVFYLVYKSPVRVTKSASNVVMHGGGVSALKITLIVRNISNKPIKDVEVFDTAPSIASIEKDVEIGTLRPTDILRNKKGGILLKWKISELEGKEERLITYKIKSKLDIVGTILLSRARVKFKMPKGQQRTSYSNTYRVGGETEKKE